MFMPDAFRRLMPAALAMLLVACGPSGSTPDGASAPDASTGTDTAAATECTGTLATRKQPYFGDLHIHTKLSFDAYFFNSLNGPREAYRFAQGEDQFLPAGDDPDTPVRRVNIGRPLDFAAVTEHAEQLGTFYNICQAQGAVPAGTNPACNVLGGFIRDNVSTFITGDVPLYLQLTTSLGSNVPSTRTWQDIQAIANEEYKPCRFTTFNGYEFSSNKGGQVLHRNVIFAGTKVPADVISSVPPLPTTDNTNDEWGLFDKLKSGCLDVAGCDVITIPHSTNQSDGRFARPREADTGLPLARDNRTLTVADALLRNRLDRAMEIAQHKGLSECITGARPGLSGEEDGACGFEEWKTLCRGEADDPAACRAICKGEAGDPLFCQVNRYHGSKPSIHAAQPCTAVAPGKSTPNDCTSPLDYLRNILPEGMALSRLLKINPYRYGVIGSSDTHNGLAGRTDKRQFAKNTGHGGVLDDEPDEALGRWTCRLPDLPTDAVIGIKPAAAAGDPADPASCRDRHFNPVASNFTPGGLAGVWARENTRAEIFAALKRRETFATSGSRLRIRTLASNTPFPADICDRLSRGESPLDDGSVKGVAMGGVLPAGSGGPYIVAWAMQDPGGEDAGIPLQRLELVKTWADAGQAVREQTIVLREQPDAPRPAADCSLTLRGPEQLCAVYQDRQFDPRLGASYYARALENSSCRWSTRICADKGVQCGLIDRANGVFPASSDFAGYEGCCRLEGEPGSFTGKFRFITQQERGWSSPIWVE